MRGLFGFRRDLVLRFTLQYIIPPGCPTHCFQTTRVLPTTTQRCRRPTAPTLAQKLFFCASAPASSTTSEEKRATTPLPKGRVLVFAGSTRTDSYNKKLARLAAVAVAQAGAQVQLVDLKHFRMPLYDGDLEKEYHHQQQLASSTKNSLNNNTTSFNLASTSTSTSMPFNQNQPQTTSSDGSSLVVFPGFDGLAAILRFKQLMIESDAFIISTPEYNSSYSGVLKNAIDWASRPPFPLLWNGEKRNFKEKELAAFRGKAALLLSASPGRLGGLRSVLNLKALLSNLQVVVLPDTLSVPFADKAFQPDMSQNRELIDIRMTTDGYAEVVLKENRIEKGEEEEEQMNESNKNKNNNNNKTNNDYNNDKLPELVMLTDEKMQKNVEKMCAKLALFAQIMHSQRDLF